MKYEIAQGLVEYSLLAVIAAIIIALLLGQITWAEARALLASVLGGG